MQEKQRFCCFLTVTDDLYVMGLAIAVSPSIDRTHIIFKAVPLEIKPNISMLQKWMLAAIML